MVVVVVWKYVTVPEAEVTLEPAEPFVVLVVTTNEYEVLVVDVGVQTIRIVGLRGDLVLSDAGVSTQAVNVVHDLTWTQPL